ncbi:hypothetical protein HDU79_007745 [Rhizoclosmatium sp. JEL0117]|nr:hypothetical protein HDU79_007745 [Rhizoclosmatium sp. JEL0117]
MLLSLLAATVALAGQTSPINITCQDPSTSLPVAAKIEDAYAQYPESPLIYNGQLLFVDYSFDRIAIASTGSTFWSMKGCGPSAVTLFHDTFLVTCYDDNSIVQLTSDGKNTLARIAKGKDGSGFLGPNDFGLDSVGGVYFTASGVWDVSAPAQGAVYYIPSPTSFDKVITENIYQVASGIHYPNGLAVIHRGRTLLVSATLANTVYSYQIYKICTEQETRFTLSRPKIFADLNVVAYQRDLIGGYMGPDGIRLKDGVLYQAQFGGARILKFREDGALIGTINFKSPFRNHTNVWVDGTTLYATATTEIDRANGSTVYPGVVMSINDPKLKTRKELD